MKHLVLLFLLTALVPAQDARRAESPGKAAAARRPNILFAIADDWGWPHAGAYGDAVVQTPHFDSVARRGVLFHRAFVSSPSCTPSRGAILTGQFHWRLRDGANLYGTFLDEFETYPELLAAAGYAAGSTGKAWGPGRPETRARPLAGQRYRSFAAFLQDRPRDRPFVFWLGSSDPHRGYDLGSGERSGMDLSKVHLFGHCPDHPTIRGDVADYYFEVQRFDRLVGDALRQLEASGELRNTIVVVTGDHGMPFPRCKSNLYDCGTRVPLAVMWGEAIPGGRESRAFTSLTDLAPTFLEAAGLRPPATMTGRSLLPLLRDPEHVPSGRGEVIFGKERHVPAQEAPDMGGYPCRALRTEQYLYIRNFAPDRWPNGTPDFAHAAVPGNWFADTDNGPSKTYIIENQKKDEVHRRAYALCFARRPAEELYDLAKDPEQLRNVAGDPAMAEVKDALWQRLEGRLRATGDPRVLGGGEKFDAVPYTGGGPKHPSWARQKGKQKARQKDKQKGQPRR